MGHGPLLLEASPLKRSLGFYSPLDRGLPLAPALLFRDASIESVKPLEYLPTPLHAHRRVPFVPFFCAALTSSLREEGKVCSLALFGNFTYAELHP